MVSKVLKLFDTALWTSFTWIRRPEKVSNLFELLVDHLTKVLSQEYKCDSKVSKFVTCMDYTNVRTSSNLQIEE